ncbi:MAG: insulinase family protein [Anaerolineales bacterium]|nr:insulinase family protein [Anaerolineales bacterium]
MYQTHILENGLRVYLIPVPIFQSVSIGIFVRVGSRYERQPEAGVSHFIEHMLFKGTTRRPSARIIAETIEGVGGVSNAYTSQETTVYYAKVAAAQASTALDVLGDMVRHPLFDPAEFEKERYVIGEELNMIYDSPDSWASVLLDQVLWPDHPLGHNIVGTAESLTGLSRDALTAYFGANYHPQNMLVAIGGAFDPDKILAEVTSLLGDWQPQPASSFEPAALLQTQARWHVEDRNIEQGHLCLALPGLSRRDPDRYALSVLNAVLGEGMSSRLFLNIREEKGLAYAVDSSLNLLQDTGSLVIYAGVDPDRAPEALQAVLDELDRLRTEPVPSAELHKVKEYLKGRLVLGLEDSFSRAAWVAYQALFWTRSKAPKKFWQPITRSRLRMFWR